MDLLYKGCKKTGPFLNGTGQCNFSGQRDRQSFLSRDKGTTEQNFLHCPGTKYREVTQKNKRKTLELGTSTFDVLLMDSKF